jgi:hypothetical protein
VAEEAEKSIHRHAFWLYGVLVGVAIKEALETGVSHLVNPDRLTHDLTHLQVAINFPDSQVGLGPEIIRITVFLVLIVRFYLGSAFFFGAAYESETAGEIFPITNYAADFIFGFIHFVSFVILALLIDIHITPIHNFPYLVGFILIYDIFWCASSFRRSTVKLIVWWMLVNVVTALSGAVIYLILEFRYGNVLMAEKYAFCLVIIVSLLDIGLMMAKRPFFQPLGKIIPRDVPGAPPVTPASPDPIPE